jgi:tetratricopeptide (TPR) repeat protein
LQRKVQKGVEFKDWKRAGSNIDTLEKLLPENDRGNLDGQRFRIAVGEKDYQKASKVLEKLAAGLPDNAMLLNQLAWEIAVADKSDKRDWDLAETVARHANEATKEENAEIVDTLARVVFLKGQKEKALELQQKAVKFAQGRRQTQFQKTLDSYKEGRAPKAY